MEFLDRYSGIWQLGPDKHEAINNKLSRTRACMVIMDELNMIDIGGWNQANTMGIFNSITGEWEYNNNTVMHNDR